MRARRFVLWSALIVLVGFFSLLGWALARSGGLPGGLGVNSAFGEVKVKKEPAPDFSLQLFDGGSIRLSDLRGKVVLLDFWASWCAPCRKEAPVLAQIYLEYRDRGVEFVGISIWDRRDDGLDYIERFGLAYPTGVDTEGTILVDYGVTGIPEKFVIDSQGNKVRKFVGPSTVEELRGILDDVLAASS
ncbi:MAG: TlpA family protein disulfide reductase [Chloroflexi bacterium]|nr:TlpA family protein disulfide reductase [Chloroflexota bacterium]